MRTMDELKALVERACEKGTRNNIVQRGIGFYTIKKVLMLQPISERAAVKIEKACLDILDEDAPVKSTCTKRGSMKSNAEKLQEMLTKVKKHNLIRQYGLSSNSIKSIESGGRIYTKTLKKFNSSYKQIMEEEAPKEKPAKAPKKSKPNPRPDLLRDLVTAARDPQLHEVLAALAVLRSKYNGKTESALALLARMEEDGIPLSVFAP